MCKQTRSTHTFTHKDAHAVSVTHANFMQTRTMMSACMLCYLRWFPWWANSTVCWHFVFPDHSCFWTIAPDQVASKWSRKTLSTRTHKESALHIKSCKEVRVFYPLKVLHVKQGKARVELITQAKRHTILVLRSLKFHEQSNHQTNKEFFFCLLLTGFVLRPPPPPPPNRWSHVIKEQGVVHVTCSLRSLMLVDLHGPVLSPYLHGREQKKNCY